MTSNQSTAAPSPSDGRAVTAPKDVSPRSSPTSSPSGSWSIAKAMPGSSVTGMIVLPPSASARSRVACRSSTST
jgi:hypothetical protein